MMAVGIGFGLSAAVLAAALGLKAFFLVVLGFGCCGFFYGGLNPQYLGVRQCVLWPHPLSGEFFGDESEPFDGLFWRDHRGNAV